jgi:hypothetical protein
VQDDEFVRVLLQEKGWDNHQDVQGFMRSPLMETRRSRLMSAMG